MAISGNVTIEVTPEVLAQKASEVNGSISSVEKRLGELKNLVEHTKYYWVGIAGDHHRQIYSSQEEDIHLILQRLKEHPTDLQQIAGIYDKTESNIGDQNGAIPSVSIT